MTLSWPRLTWPAWDARQAGPRWRKMSATSTAGRGNGLALAGHLQQEVERARHLAERIDGDAGIKCGRVELYLALPILGRRTTRLRLAKLRALKLHRPARPCRPAAEARRMPLVLTALGCDQPPLYCSPDRRNLFASPGAFDPSRVDPATGRAYKSWRRRPPFSCPPRLAFPSSRRLFSPL